MGHSVRGVVAAPDPGPVEALAPACSIDHTDWHYREGASNAENNPPKVPKAPPRTPYPPRSTAALIRGR